MPLQRVLTDFGADHAFAQVSKKLGEHYGITMPISTIRKVTEYHGARINQQREIADFPMMESDSVQQIVESDGCMLPIVTTKEEEGDKRKGKKLHWKEARLALAHELGSVTLKFDATFGASVNDAGQSLLNCAVAAGFGYQTQVHSVGDGATWIAAQIDDKFGLNGSYLVDFYHLCEYLSEASKSCMPTDNQAWTETQKDLLKANKYMTVLENLLPNIEPKEVDEDHAPVRACHRYINNRTDQLDYLSAIEKGLPIGSGEIESAHRYVIQQRLKLPGAWWKAANVEPMLALRVVRANNEWDEYWKDIAEAA